MLDVIGTEPPGGKILVIGGTGFLGFRVVAALIEARADVTVMVRPEREEKLRPLAKYIRIIYGDVWNKASLKGRARGHKVILHLVGSTHADPARGFTFQQINLVSARNVTAMAVSDGVPAMVFLSTVMRPWDLAGDYIYSKRAAEEYIRSSGLGWTIIRAPALYAPGQSGLRFLAAGGNMFPFGFLLGNRMPLSVDVAARGIAHIALKPAPFEKKVVYTRQLRRVARANRQHPPLARPLPAHTDNTSDALDESPFGWLPPGH